MRAEHDALRKAAADTTALESDLAKIEAELEKLDNPKSRIKQLESDASREFEFREAITKIESNLERLESERMILVEQLESL